MIALYLLLVFGYYNHVAGIVISRLDLLRQKDQNLLNKLKDYELIHPQETIPLNRNELFPDIYQQEETVERSISFPYKGEKIILDLVPNKGLLSPRYKERFFLPDGRPVMEKRTVDSFFHGHVRGEEGKSNLAIRTDNGYRGYFKYKDNLYLIQPLFLKNNKRTFHIVYNSNGIESKLLKRGNAESKSDHIKPFVLNHHHRSRRNVLNETKYLELMIVNDVSQYNQFDSDLNKTNMRAIEIANVVDAVYRQFHIRIVLVAIETWRTKNRIDVVCSAHETLDNFIDYKVNVLNKDEATKHHDNAQFVTQFGTDAVGLAYGHNICTDRSGAFNTDDEEETALIIGQVMAHEMGHNFGLPHDEGECLCPDGCIMASRGRLTQKFSQCSISLLEKSIVTENVGSCLFNKPTEILSDISCGNGILETGEECDCGTKEECESAGDVCCNHIHCKLYEGNQCSDGECCENCQYRAQGTLCRDVVNSCDLPEYCTGVSEVCVPDVYLLNGLSCDNHNAYCYFGQCRTHTAQCQSLWNGVGVMKGDDACYESMNTGGNEYGYCEKFGPETYKPCEPANVQCGKLQCTGIDLTAIEESGNTTSVSFGEGSEITCETITLLEEVDDLGMVEDGIKCDDGKICMENKCKALSVVFPGNPSCTNDVTCHGNGVCNQYGNCHCNAGWKCPFCAEPYSGPGGSVNSGGESCGFQSCSQLKSLFPELESGAYKINLAGDSNGAFYVHCDMTSENGIGVTLVGHNSEKRIEVYGYEKAGNYSRKIVYPTSYANLAVLTDLSAHCEQFIKYECHNAMLLEDGDSWWVSRNGDRMDYWGGATGHPGKCGCGVANSCDENNVYCNCDINDGLLRKDEGYLTDKATLPVKELRFGDTGGNYGSEFGYHTLGKLKCWG